MAKARQAPSPAARQAAAQRADRDEATAITAAVAETELEITDSIFDDDALDLDGDDTLETMGDDLDGDTDVEDDDGVQARGGSEDTEGDEDSDDEGGEDDDVDPADTPEGDLDDDDQLDAGAGDQDEPDDRPSPRRQETSELQTQIAELKGAIATIAQQLSGAQPPKQTAKAPAAEEEEAEPPAVDIFADPAGHDKRQKWEQRQRDKQLLNTLRTEQLQLQVQNADETMAEMAEGPQGKLFKEAHKAFMDLPQSEAKAKLGQRILRAFNPARAMLEWYETEGDERDRAEALRLSQKYGFDLPAEIAPARGERRGGREQRGDPGREQPQNGRQPRQEFRKPQRMPASLNGAGGGVRQQIDPRGLDGSDASVAAYVFDN